jgi:hypothetical protein
LQDPRLCVNFNIKIPRFSIEKPYFQVGFEP